MINKKNLLILASAAILLCSCGIQTAKPLYSWGWYQDSIYSFYKNQTPESVCNLVAAYEEIVSHPTGSRMVPPPGICAEYAFLLQKPETAAAFRDHATKQQRKLFEGDDYEHLFREKALELLKKEVELYPESEIFIKAIAKSMTGE